MINVGRPVAACVAVASALMLTGACDRAEDASESSPASISSVAASAASEREGSEASPAFCSAASAETACASTAEVLSFWGGRPLFDTDVWNRTWVLERARDDRAGQGGSVVSVLFESDPPATLEKAFDLSYPAIQQTIVTDPAPDGRRFADRPQDLDDSDGLTKRWIELGGRRMLHFATREIDQLQFVEPLEGGLGVYVEVTLASGRFETLKMVGESLAPLP